MTREMEYQGEIREIMKGNSIKWSKNLINDMNILGFTLNVRISWKTIYGESGKCNKNTDYEKKGRLREQKDSEDPNRKKRIIAQINKERNIDLRFPEKEANVDINNINNWNKVIEEIYRKGEEKREKEKLKEKEIKEREKVIEKEKANAERIKKQLEKKIKEENKEKEKKEFKVLKRWCKIANLICKVLKTKEKERMKAEATEMKKREKYVKNVKIVVEDQKKTVTTRTGRTIKQKTKESM